MKTAQILDRVFDGVLGAPAIIETKTNLLSELSPIFARLQLSYRQMPRFNMASTFLTRQILTNIMDLDIVEKIYVDWPVKLPEFPIGFSAADLIMQRGFLGFGVLQAGMGKKVWNPEEWITTLETRRFLGVSGAEQDGVTGRGVKVGIVDTDASARAANHRQLMGKNVQRYHVRPAFQTDSNGHGMHVATTIGGKLVQAVPNFYVEGMAPDADLILVKALLTPLGTGSTSDCIAALQIAFDRGADVVNMSLGSEATDPSEDAFVKAVNMLPPEKIVCAASGNESASKIGSPAIAEHALAIGAINIRTGLRADFSNTGPELAFAMPGVNIFSGLTRETLCDAVGGGPEGFAMLSGTSMATPHATGMVALAIDLMRRHNFQPTVETFRELGRRYGTPHNNEYGYGPLTYQMIKQYVQENLT